MSLLIFTYRHQDIIARKSDLNFKLDGLRRKLMDLQSYAASIADGQVTLNDLASVPPSQFARMSIFMQSSSQAAYAGAQEKFAYMSQIPGAMPQMETAELQKQYSEIMIKQLYDQGIEKFGEQEAKLLNVEDKKIQQQVTQMETKLKMLDAEEEKVTKAEDEAAKKSAPQYVA